ncbi:MAG: hypothetical protein FWH18_06755 [Marinilabiliaceae bacterium]|nr:hypothetical protein [Marinilabiliaceae bacterium]
MKIKYLIIVILLISCSNSKERPTNVIIERSIVNSLNDTLFTEKNLIADSIIYSVMIVNTDEYDSWSSFRLRNMNQIKIVSEIFDKIYAGEIIAYEYHENRPLSIDEVKQLENRSDFSRELIEEIMFEESWFYSPETNTFHKEVYSLVFAYATYTDDGVRKDALKAAFKIYLKKQSSG